MQQIRKKIAKFLVALFAVQAITVINILTAQAVACTSTQVKELYDTAHMTYFATDYSSQSLQSGYVGLAVSSTYATNPHVKVVSTSSNIALAANQSNVVVARSSGNASGTLSSYKLAYIYMTTTAQVKTSENISYEIYDGDPSTTGVLKCTYTQSFSTGIGDGNAGNAQATMANSVTSISSTLTGSTAVGQTFTVTLNGDTGNWAGAGRVDPYSAFQAATALNWPANDFQLVGIYFKNTTTGVQAYDKITTSGLSSSTSSDTYQTIYTFYVNSWPNTNVKLQPINYVLSGTQLKHNDKSQFTNLAGVTLTTNSTSAGQVTTNSASNVTETTSKLNGQVDAGTMSNGVYFCYGNSSGAVSTCNDSVTATASGGNYYANLTGLTGGTTYYFEFVGKNSTNTFTGGIKNFTTLVAGAIDTTTAASSITINSAVLNGESENITPGGSSPFYFLISTINPGSGNHLDPSNDETITATSTLSGSPYTYVASATGLSDGTKYYYELVVRDASGATYLGGVLNFTTLPIINFNPNSGTLASGNSVDTSTASIGADALLSKPATDPTRSGYTFVGWNTSSSSTTALSAYTLTGSITLYAIWRLNSGSSGGSVYVPNPPTITSISAPEICAIGDQLIVKGTNLRGATATLDGAAVRVVSSSNNELALALPMAMAGVRSLKVTNADGSASTTVKYTFVDTPVYVNYTYPLLYKDLEFSYTFTATDANKYAIQGRLPAGLSIDPLTGEIKGTPTVDGEFVFTIVASNVCGNAYLNVFMFIDKEIP